MGRQVNPQAFTWADDANALGAWAAAGLNPEDPLGGKGWAFDGFDTTLLLTNNCMPTWGTNLCSGTCAINCTNDMELYSFHTGGVNALMADGSVRFLSANTPLKIVAALITYSGDEIQTE
jgi:prepilin-type processing-associated H-X9-DG protein